jgi:dTDP-4-dehydrorhamnose reductase
VRREKILILGVTGMLGHTLFKEMLKNKRFDVFGTTRNKNGLESFFNQREIESVIANIDADKYETVNQVIKNIQPTVIINCIGLIKQLPISNQPLEAININAQLPHLIALTARSVNARFIHFSTDCVFNGEKGNYDESDFSDARDLYGRTKFLGEVTYPNCITLRTSIIGHELRTNFSLVNWFLEQENMVRGFCKAMYSGLPTIEIVNVIENYVIPNKKLNGLYQVSSAPISKYDLLQLIKKTYNKDITIEPDEKFVLDRTLNSEKFRTVSGYTPPDWNQLIKKMYSHFIDNTKTYL